MNWVCHCYLIIKLPASLSKWFTIAVKLRIIDQYKQEWFSDISNNLSCVNYKIFKNSFSCSPEDYLIRLPKDLGLPLLKFRSRNVYLPGVLYYPQQIVTTATVGVTNQTNFTIFYLFY